MGQRPGELEKCFRQKLTFGEKQIIKAYSMWAFGHVDMRTCGHAHMWRCRHAHMWTCGHADMWTCAHAHMSTCRHVHMRTWRHSDMRTCGHADMRSPGRPWIVPGRPWVAPVRPRVAPSRPKSCIFSGVDYEIGLETIINGRSMPWSFGCTKCRLERMKLKPFYGFARLARRP